MTRMQIIKPAVVAAAIALVGFGASSLTSLRADSSNTDSRIQIGFNIAPVKLNMNGLNPALVGIGSYIVNAQADCNGCHNSPDLGGEWAVGHNPYFGQPKTVNGAG